MHPFLKHLNILKQKEEDTADMDRKEFYIPVVGVGDKLFDVHGIFVFYYLFCFRRKKLFGVFLAYFDIFQVLKCWNLFSFKTFYSLKIFIVGTCQIKAAKSCKFGSKCGQSLMSTKSYTARLLRNEVNRTFA